MVPAVLFLAAVMAGLVLVVLVLRRGLQAAGMGARAVRESAAGQTATRVLNYTPPPLAMNVAFDLTPIDGFSSELSFRTPIESDLAVLAEIMRDPATRAANGWTAETAEEWATRLAGDPALFATRASEWLFAEEIASGSIVGYASIGPMEGRHGISMALSMRKGFRRKGYGTQLTAAMIVVLQSTFRFDIWALTRPENTASHAIFERLGYEPEPTTAQRTLPDGTTVDMVVYSCGFRTHPPMLAEW